MSISVPSALHSPRHGWWFHVPTSIRFIARKRRGHIHTNLQPDPTHRSTTPVTTSTRHGIHRLRDSNQQRSTHCLPWGYRKRLLLSLYSVHLAKDTEMRTSDITRLVRRAAVLPLVPQHLVEDVWLNAHEDIGEADNVPDTTSFTDYVTEFWVEGHRFLWNHYQTEGPRTTNHLECWHNKIKKKVHHAHPRGATEYPGKLQNAPSSSTQQEELAHQRDADTEW